MTREPDGRLLGSARPNPRRLIGPPESLRPHPVRGRLLGRAVPAKPLLRPQARVNRKRDQGRNRGRGGPTCGQASCGNAQSRRERGRGGSEQRGEGGLLCSEPECPGAASSGPGFSLCSEWSSREAAGLFTYGGSPGCASSTTPRPLTQRPTDPPTHPPHRSSSRGGSPPSRPHLVSAGAEGSTGGH